MIYRGVKTWVEFALNSGALEHWRRWGPAAGTARILELPDDVMVYILQHVEDGNTLLVVIPSVGEPGQPGPDGFF